MTRVDVLVKWKNSNQANDQFVACNVMDMENKPIKHYIGPLYTISAMSKQMSE